MDARLARLIADYQSCVAAAVELLARAGVPRPASNTAWTAQTVQNGEFLPGFSMFKHGFGCSVKGPGVTVDFDVGTSGQTDGFDSGRLQAFATRRRDLYGFPSLADIRRTLAEATEHGEVSVDVDHLSYLASSGPVSSIFPQVEHLPEGRTQYRWTTRLERPVGGSLHKLSDEVRNTTLARYRQALRTGGQADHAGADLYLEVEIAEAGLAVYELRVRSAGHAPNWDMASLFGVMQTFDELAGPALEIQGRIRSECPPWFLHADRPGSG